MNRLNKIIFINSANIPYNEMLLDGNVHLSGNQGSGKTTVIRAVLFFFTADKMRLGIESGKRSFEDFYFPFSNSYIIYEVKTDSNAFSVVAMRSQGKIVYRFIDSPFSRHWFVRPDGRAESEWSRIRENVGESIEISPKVDTYQMFRDIIYGDLRDRNHRFDKYALAVCRNYQNIPQSIQNVFLNSKLDAEFIKDTIIQSMPDMSEPINLSNYRRHLAGFKDEFEDVDKWFSKKKEGQTEVREQAKAVMDAYSELSNLEYEVRKLWHQLNYCVRVSSERIPYLNDEIARLEGHIRECELNLRGLDDEFKTQHDELTRNIGGLDGKLKEIRLARKKYEDMGIVNIIKEYEEKPLWTNRLQQKQFLLNTLQRSFADITERFNALYKALDEEVESVKLSYDKRRNSLRADFMTEEQKAREDYHHLQISIDKTYGEFIDSSNKRLAVLYEDKVNCSLSLSELTSWKPLSVKIDNCIQEIKRLHDDEFECKAKKNNLEKERELLNRQMEMEVSNLEGATESRLSAIRQDIEQLNARLEDVHDRLQNYDGSLYQSLEANRPGWKENIGKVVAEKVLYAHGLEPRYGVDNGLYGVEINLDVLDVQYISIEEYVDLQDSLNKEIAAKKSSLAVIEVEYKEQCRILNKHYKELLAANEAEISKMAYQVELLPQKIKDVETSQRKLEAEQTSMVESERNKRQQLLHYAELKLDEEFKSRTAKEEKRDKETKSAKSSLDKVLREIIRREKALLSEIDDECGAELKSLDNRRLALKSDERDALVAGGADTKAIDDCNKDIERINKALEKISRLEKTVFAYQKDEADMFSHESEYKESRKRLKEKDEELIFKFEKKKGQVRKEMSDATQILVSRKDSLKGINQDLELYDLMCNVEKKVPTELSDDKGEEECGVSCAYLISSFRTAIEQKENAKGKLHASVGKFVGSFNSGNVFNFVKPETHAGYIEFAKRLREFNDNNLIETYRERISENYIGILQSISRETGNLMNHTAEIHKIIDDINEDFQQKNFASVIRMIKLRIVDSADPMTEIFKSIKDFYDKNQFSAGGMNLFSDPDRDRVNTEVVNLINRLIDILNIDAARTELAVSDAFRLLFKIKENDNETDWLPGLKSVGSKGTDIIVKAMINIMLINVFKTKASKKDDDFVVHCMLDEIGKLHSTNVAGLLKFANARNIFVINCSPEENTASNYKHGYLLEKDDKSRTRVRRIVTTEI